MADFLYIGPGPHRLGNFSLVQLASLITDGRITVEERDAELARRRDLPRARWSPWGRIEEDERK